MCLLCEHREGGQEIVLRCVYCVTTGKEAQEIVLRCVYCVNTGKEARKLC